MVSLHGPFIRNKNALKEYWNTALSLLCYYREINPVFTIGQHSTGANLEIPFTVHFSRPWLCFVIHCTRLRESWKWKAPGLIPASCFSIQLFRLRWPGWLSGFADTLYLMTFQRTCTVIFFSDFSLWQHIMLNNMLCALQSGTWMQVHLTTNMLMSDYKGMLCFLFRLYCIVLSFSRINKGPLNNTWQLQRFLN